MVPPRCNLVWCHRVSHSLSLLRVGPFPRGIHTHHVTLTASTPSEIHCLFLFCLIAFYPENKGEMYICVAHCVVSGMKLLCYNQGPFYAFNHPDLHLHSYHLTEGCTLWRPMAVWVVPGNSFPSDILCSRCRASPGPGSVFKEERVLTCVRLGHTVGTSPGPWRYGSCGWRREAERRHRTTTFRLKLLCGTLMQPSRVQGLKTWALGKCPLPRAWIKMVTLKVVETGNKTKF